MNGTDKGKLMGVVSICVKCQVEIQDNKNRGSERVVLAKWGCSSDRMVRTRTLLWMDAKGIYDGEVHWAEGGEGAFAVSSFEWDKGMVAGEQQGQNNVYFYTGRAEPL